MITQQQIEGPKQAIGKTVLVVDDELKILEVVPLMLKKFGYNVIIAKNGEEAIKLFERNKPDLVLLDVRMPVLDGCNAYSCIKDKNPNAKIVFMTAYATDTCVREIIKSQNTTLLEKPFNSSTMKNMIERHLSV